MFFTFLPSYLPRTVSYLTVRLRNRRRRRRHRLKLGPQILKNYLIKWVLSLCFRFKLGFLKRELISCRTFRIALDQMWDD